jgi:hypothetical protein
MASIPLIVFLVVSSVSSLAAQWPAGIAAGARVQARLPEVQYQVDGRRGQLVRGRVTALTPDSLYLAITDSLGPVAVPRHLIERLAYSRGVPSRVSSAARRGLFAAAGTALLFVLLNEMDEEPGRASTGSAALVGAGVGLTTGALLGAIYPRERWKGVHLEKDSSSVRSARDELGLAAD